MKTKLLLAVMLLCASLFSTAEEILQGHQAYQTLRGTELLRLEDHTSIPTFIKFRESDRISVNNWQSWMKMHFFKESKGVGFDLIGEQSDKMGMTHYRYQQTVSGVPMSFAIWIVHTLNGEVVSMNGELFENIPSTQPSLTEQAALQAALDHMDASTYMWEVPAEEEMLKMMQNDPTATYLPNGSLEVFTSGLDGKTIEHHLAWKFDIYAHTPHARKELYFDASNGSLLFENERIHHADSAITAQTMYSGEQTLIADHDNGNFCLHETGRGNGIHTWNLNYGTDFSAAVDFCDSTNVWDDTLNFDQYSTDAHFGTEMYYDYLMDRFNRNSIDDNGFALHSYVHYSTNLVNAGWDGARMIYGDGNGGAVTPLTSLDVCGHEVTHGLNTFTANEVYWKEAGALNESFSDIFGSALEFYVDPTSADWTMGEDFGLIIRSMSNPNLYGQPDTYLGGSWQTTAGDNYGVHTNSGVQNYWFYLISEGGSGTNDNGDAFSVDSIGVMDAEAIAFRNLTVYMTRFSNYADARFYSIQAAVDLFGACSQQVESTWSGWYAVGVGPDFSSNSVSSDFVANLTSNCSAPLAVQFYNQSYQGNTFLWNFGDGNTSTAFEPTHTYTSAGDYTVSLHTSSSCGADSITKVDYMRVGSSDTCHVLLASNGTAVTQTNCEGIVYDDGGPMYGYSPNSDAMITIAPTGAQSVTLTFLQWVIVCDGADYLYVYDGSDSLAPLLGLYCEDSPPPASITSSGSAITLVFRSNEEWLEDEGFAVAWACNTPEEAPIAGFSVDRTYSCGGTANFTDQSALGPNTATSWFWDFGDGNTSTLQNPSHTYQNEGVYTVKCAAINPFGTDTMTIVNLIEKALPMTPTGPDVEVCPGDQATLIAYSTGTNTWYDSDTGSTVLTVGDTFVTPIVNQSTPFYVENYGAVTTDTTGAPNKLIGTGANTSLDQGLYFDALSDFRLHAVTVYTLLPGDRHIFIEHPTNGVVHDTTINIATGEVTLLLDFDIEAGQDYLFKVDNTQMNGLWRNNGGVDYPYEIPGMVSIYGSTAGPGFYYWFYNWQVQELCTSEREMISASTGVCTGVSEIAEEAYQLFPNPTDRMMTVKWSSTERPQGMQLYSASGALARTIPVPHSVGQVELDLGGLSQGVYFLQINEGANVITKRVVTQ
ncbi:MAG: M4 family metallopeptidase [Flavobacteriales bacterium]|nr:M4 family metallopeptidase [Flavobacteriales bacterium]